MYGSVPEAKKHAPAGRARYYLAAAVSVLAAAAVALGPGRRVVKSLLYTKTVSGTSWPPPGETVTINGPKYSPPAVKIGIGYSEACQWGFTYPLYCTQPAAAAVSANAKPIDVNGKLFYTTDISVDIGSYGGSTAWCTADCGVVGAAVPGVLPVIPPAPHVPGVETPYVRPVPPIPVPAKPAAPVIPPGFPFNGQGLAMPTMPTFSGFPFTNQAPFNTYGTPRNGMPGTGTLPDEAEPGSVPGNPGSLPPMARGPGFRTGGETRGSPAGEMYFGGQMGGSSGENVHTMGYAAVDQDPPSSATWPAYKALLAGLFCLSLVLAGYHLRGQIEASNKEPKSPAPPKDFAKDFAGERGFVSPV